LGRDNRTPRKGILIYWMALMIGIVGYMARDGPDASTGRILTVWVSDFLLL
jgi:hypothetical protein